MGRCFGSEGGGRRTEAGGRAPVQHRRCAKLPTSFRLPSKQPRSIMWPSGRAGHCLNNRERRHRRPTHAQTFNAAIPENGIAPHSSHGLRPLLPCLRVLLKVKPHTQRRPATRLRTAEQSQHPLARRRIRPARSRQIRPLLAEFRTAHPGPEFVRRSRQSLRMNSRIFCRASGDRSERLRLESGVFNPRRIASSIRCRITGSCHLLRDASLVSGRLAAARIPSIIRWRITASRQPRRMPSLLRERIPRSRQVLRADCDRGDARRNISRATTKAQTSSRGDNTSANGTCGITTSSPSSPASPSLLRNTASKSNSTTGTLSCCPSDPIHPNRPVSRLDTPRQPLMPPP